MRKAVAVMMSWLWVVALIAQAIPAEASGLGDGAPGFAAPLRIEGEQYSAVNQTPVAKAERDTLRGSSTDRKSVV